MTRRPFSCCSKGVHIPSITLCLTILSISASTLIARAAPGAPDSLAEAGLRYYLEGQYRYAIQSLTSASADSLTARVAFYLGSSYAALNDVAGGRRYLEIAVNRQPENTGYRFRLGQLLAQGGEPAQAETQFNAVLSKDSTYLPAIYQLGLLAHDRKDFDAAIQLFQKLLTLNPHDYLSQYYLGSAMVSRGTFDSARAVLSSCISLNPSYTPAIALLASLYYLKPDYREALRLYRRAIAQRPDNASYWYSVGLCYEKLDDGYSAVDAYRTAAQHDTTDALILAHLGQAWFQIKRFDSAATSYARATVLDPDNPTLLVNLALSWQRLDSINRAASAFQQAIRAHEPEKIGRTYGQLGALLFIAERYRDARQAYRRSLQIDPLNLESQFYLALVYDHLSDLRAARDAYRRFVRNASAVPAMKEKLAVASKRLKLLDNTSP